MRLLVCNAAISPYRHDFFNALAERFELTLFCHTEPYLSGYKVEERSPDRRYDVVSHITSGRYDLSFLHPLRALTRRLRPDVMVMSEFSLVSLAAALGMAGTDCPRLLWTDDSLQDCETAGAARRLRRGLVTRAARAVVTCNRAARDWYAGRYPGHRVFRVPILQHEATFRNSLQRALPRSSELRERYELQGRRVVLFLGRLVWEKDLGCLIEAARALPEGVILVIAGDGPERLGLEARAASKGPGGRIVFCGEARGTDVFAWYNLAELFVLPSISERFGAVVNEALLAGVPVLCSSVAGAGELIVAGENGELFQPGDPAVLGRLMAAWIGRLPRLPPDPVVRPSLMTASFRQCIDEFSAAAEYAGTRGGEHAL